VERPQPSGSTANGGRQCLSECTFSSFRCRPRLCERLGLGVSKAKALEPSSRDKGKNERADHLPSSAPLAAPTSLGFSNPARYASAVREIIVLPPSRPHSATNLSSTPASQGELDVFLALLEACSQTVERVQWRGVQVWGDAVSQVSPLLPGL
jgi:hypothetical protein